jgi:hypothetical protein
MSDVDLEDPSDEWIDVQFSQDDRAETAELLEQLVDVLPETARTADVDVLLGLLNDHRRALLSGPTLLPPDQLTWLSRHLRLCALCASAPWSPPVHVVIES